MRKPPRIWFHPGKLWTLAGLLLFGVALVVAVMWHILWPLIPGGILALIGAAESNGYRQELAQNPNPSVPGIRETVIAEVAALRAMTYAQLCELTPMSGNRTVQGSDGRASMCTWRDLLENGEVRIVVQAYRPWFLGIGSMQACGFCATRDSIRDLRDEELWDFT